MEIKGAVEIGCGQTMKRLKCFGLYPEGIRGYGMVSGNVTAYRMETE